MSLKDQEETQAPEQDEFDEAWDEGEGAASAEQPAEPAQEAGDEPKDQDEEGPAQEPGQADKDKAQPAQADDPMSRVKELEAALEKERHTSKSLLGRLQKEQQERKAREGKGEAPGKSGQGQSLKTIMDGLPREQRAVVEGVIGDPDSDLGKALDILLEAKLGAVAPTIQETRQAVEQIQAERETVALQQHYAPATEKHPDWWDVVKSKEFADWVNALPTRERAWALHVYEHGTVEEGIEVMDAYKAARGRAPAATHKPAPRRDSRADAAAAVKTGGRGIPATAVKAPKDDYDAAWAEDD